MQSDAYLKNSMEGYQHALSTMMQMMWSQASGISSGNHGLFLRYHIEALTLEGIIPKKGKPRGLEQAGRYVSDTQQIITKYYCLIPRQGNLTRYPVLDFSISSSLSRKGSQRDLMLYGHIISIHILHKYNYDR